MSSSANERPASEHRILGRDGASFSCHCPKDTDHWLNVLKFHPVRTTEEVADELIEVIRDALEQAWNEGYHVGARNTWKQQWDVLGKNPYRVSK